MERYKYKHKKVFKTKRKKFLLKNKTFWLFVFLLFLLGSGGFFAFHYKILEIKEIVILGNQKIKTEDIKPVLEKETIHKILFIKTRNVFLADLEKINKDLLKTFPLIANIKTEKTLLGVLKAQIIERVPIGILCDSQSCFYFDSQGIVFEKAEGNNNFIDPSANLRVNSEQQVKIILELADYRITLTNKEITEENAEGILELGKKLKDNFNIGLSEIVLSSNQKQLRVKTSEGWTIFFEPENALLEQISNLNILLADKTISKDRKNLDYIDMRYGSKIFYKKKQ